MPEQPGMVRAQTAMISEVGMGILSKLFGKPKPKYVPQPFTAPIAPEQAFCAVGDVHGCLNQFEQIPALLKEHGMDEAPLIFVGDYIDRGEQSAQVLRGLIAMQKEAPDRIICLKGNHEQMLCDVLRNPVKHGPRWLKYGGLQAVASFGVQPVLGGGSPEQWEAMGDALREAMGQEMVDWVNDLPLTWQTGNIFVCHAGADPIVPLDFQNAKTLVWGSPAFHEMTREDGQWVVHGHTIMDQPIMKDGRISVDTGCYATGRLTCVRIAPGEVEFLTLTN